MVQDSLRDQVRRASQRLAWQRFLETLPWCWTGLLAAALAVILLDKAMPLGLPYWAWLAIAGGGGLLIAALSVLATRGSSLAAAVELDLRFGLKERVSSALALSEEERQTPMGQAVLADALRRVERIDVANEFPARLNKWSLLPAAPAALAVAVALFVPSWIQENPAQANANTASARKQIEEAAQKVRKQLLEKKQRETAEALKDAEPWMKKLEEGLKNLEAEKNLEPKQALARLNALADELQKERDKLGGADKLREQLEKLKQPGGGPADRLAQALKNGKFEEAAQALDKLKQELNKGELNDEQRKQLQEQLKALEDKLQKLAEAQQQREQQQRQDLNQQAAAGGLSREELERQLNDLAQQSSVPGLQNLAQQLGQLSQAMQNGNAQQAEQAMQNLQQQLSDLEQQLDQLQDLDQAAQSLSQCKDGLCQGNQPGASSQSGKGSGKGSQGAGEGEEEGDEPGMGLGRGKGIGARPIAEDKTGTIDRHAQLDTKNATTVVTGTASGPNLRGNVREQIRAGAAEVEASEADPLTGAKLPRNYREHVREYFNRLRKGE